jgi:hypothetical protein
MVSMAMPMSEVHEINERKLIALFTAMHAASDHETTVHGRVLANLAYWRSLSRLDRSLLFELMRDQVPPPVQRPKAPNGHADGLKREGSADHRRI